MILKRFQSHQFAGLRDFSIDFQPGLNVVLGKNEAGKTSLISAIFSTIFYGSKLNRTRREDKDFIRDYFPNSQSSGEIDGRLVFKDKDTEYQLTRVWDGVEDRLTIGEVKTLSKAKEIEKTLSEILIYGKATYDQLIFSSQRKDSFALSFREDRLLQAEISDVISESVMELDGVSIEKLEELIDKNIKDLASNWDIKGNRPKGNRGISNPYKNSVGKVLRSYYDLEEKKLQGEIAYQGERNFEEAGKNLDSIKESYQEVSNKKEKLDSIKEDIRKRETIERDLADIGSKKSQYSKVIARWPALEPEIKGEKDRLQKIDEFLETVEIAKENKKLLQEKEVLKKEIEDYKAFKRRYEEGVESFKGYERLNREGLEKLERLQRSISLIKTRLQTSSLQAQVFKADDGLELEDALGNKIKISKEVLGFGPSIKISYKDEVDLLVSLESIDVGAEKEELEKHQKDFDEVLSSSKVESLDDYREGLAKKENLYNEIRLNKNKMSLILQDRVFQDMEERYGELQKVKELELPSDQIIEANLEEKENLKFSIHDKEEEIKSYLDNFESQENLIGKLAELVADERDLSNNLESLVTLPENYESTDGFFQDLNSLDKQVSQLGLDLTEAKLSYNDAENKLYPISYEEIQKEVEELEAGFKENLSKLGAALKIKEAFDQTKVSMMEDPYSSVKETMVEYLEKISSSSLSLTEDSGNLMGIESSSKGRLTFEILSQGSKDTLSLSMRLALVENLFPNGGFVCFDDVMTDLDEDRRIEVLKILKAFSDKYQIIYTTADPRTAKDLGGNLIQI